MRNVERACGRLRTVKACATFLVCCSYAFALNPDLDINQYAHRSWTVQEGFFKGYVTSLAQTPDGYLWLGTEFGLFRFDGNRFVPWRAPAGEQLPGSYVRSMLAGHDGRLWVGTSEGLASWKDGKLTHYPELAGQTVSALAEDHEGTIWAGGYAFPTGRLCAIPGGSAHCFGMDGSLGHGVLSLYEDALGNLWAGALNGLWHWKPGPPKLYPMAGPGFEIQALIEGQGGTLLIATNGGIRELVDGGAAAYSVPGTGLGVKPKSLLRDRNGGLWIGTTDRGLLHVHPGRTDRYTQTDGLSSNSVQRVYEDREGNIWVATSNGLDHFRDYAVPTISAQQGLSNDTVWSVLAARDGSVWLGTPDGLNRWKSGLVTTYRTGKSGLPDDTVESLFQDDQGRVWVASLHGVSYFENGRFIPVTGVPGGVVHSVAGDRAGSLWIAYQDHDLYRLSGGSIVERIPWAKLRRNGYANALLPDNRSGLWLGLFQGGVAYLKDGGAPVSVAVADGLGAGIVSSLQLDRDGTLWAATQGGLSRVKDGRVATLTSKNGLPCETVHWMMEDDYHSVWLYMPCGLVRIARSELDAWVADPKRTIQSTVFDELRRSQEPCTNEWLQPTRCQIHGRQIVVRDRGRCQRCRSASHSLQQTPAARTHRANQRRPQDVRCFVKNRACPH